MKRISILAICFCAIALGGCVKDADVISEEFKSSSVVVGGEGNTSFAFTIQNESASKSTGTVEDSGVHDQGKSEEYTVNSVDIYLFDSTSELLVKSVRLQSINLTVDTATDKIVRYESDKFDVETGSYNVFAVANSSNIYNVSTQEQFLAYVDFTYKNNSLMTTIPGTGFIMTNRGADNQGVVISTNVDKVIDVTLERVVAKIDVAQDLDSFTLADSAGATYATIKLQNYMLVNLATDYYLFRHVADLTTFAEPTYSYSTNYGDVSDTNGYVIDPYFFSKSAATVGTFTNADGFFYQQLKTVDTAPNWSMMPAKNDSSVSYCLENTMYHDAQLNGYTTGVVFEAKVTPTSIIVDALGTTTNMPPAMVYYCNYQFFNSVATLAAYHGYTGVQGVDDNSTTEELEAVHITRLTLTPGGDYPCYYNYWIKHYDNNDVMAMGAMEFGVVRNNHYQISVSSIAGLGTGEPTLENDRPDETNETLEVNLNVIPWIVRDQGNVELK